MKWQERNEFKRNTWHTGPELLYYTAKKGGKQYEVCALWDSSTHKGGYSWWAHNGTGTNKKWATKEEAMAWCERDAGVAKANAGGET